MCNKTLLTVLMQFLQSARGREILLAAFEHSVQPKKNVVVAPSPVEMQKERLVNLI